MRLQIGSIVVRFLECQKAKVEHHHLDRTLHPHEIVEWKWDTISMDFIICLPLSSSCYDAILVTIDTLTKASHFSLVRTTFTS